MNEEYMDIQVFDGDEGIKYIKYDDLLELIEKLKIKQDERSKEIERLNNIIKEVRGILKYHLSNPSGTKNGWHIDIWNSEDISKLNEHLGILDKGE